MPLDESFWDKGHRYVYPTHARFFPVVWDFPESHYVPYEPFELGDRLVYAWPAWGPSEQFLSPEHALDLMIDIWATHDVLPKRPDLSPFIDGYHFDLFEELAKLPPPPKVEWIEVVSYDDGSVVYYDAAGDRFKTVELPPRPLAPIAVVLAE